MPNGFRCENCGYVLVLLDSTRKFKCAKCGKLFPQKIVEDEHFKRWNKKQRENERYNQKVEDQLKKQEKEKKKEVKQQNSLKRSLKFLFNGIRDPIKKRKHLSPEERKARKRENNRLWDENNPEKVRAIKRRQFERHRDEIYVYQKNWRVVNQRESRLKQRLAYWRKQQSKLALEQLRTGNEEIRFPLTDFRNYCLNF